MPRISYQARTLTGEVVEGKMRAHDVDDMRVTLSRKGLEIIQFHEEPAENRKILVSPKIGFARGVRSADLASATGQIAMMLETGTTIVDTLSALARQADSPKLKEVLETVAADVRAGSGLGAALDAHPAVFNKYYVSAVKTGESSGTLAEVFKRLEQDILKRESLKSSARAALIYPTILTVLATGAVTFMVTYVLPKFLAIFERSGVPLPLPTRMLLALAGFLTSYWHITLVSVVAAIVGVRYYLASEHGGSVRDTVILRLPVVGPLVVAFHSSLVLRMIGTLLDAGVPLVETLTVAQGGCGNRRFTELISHIKAGVIRGETFAETTADTDLFTPATKQMIATGEQTGKLPFVMNRMADHLDIVTDRRMKRLSAVVEPLIIIAMGIIIGFIAVSLLLPLFKLTTAVRQAA